MSAAYVPREPTSVLVVLAVVGGVLALGSLLAGSERRSSAGAWVVAGAAVLTTEFATRAEPAGWRMLALIAVLFAAMKLLVVGARAAAPLAPRAWWSFALLWVGMDPRPFAARRGTVDLAVTRALLARGSACVAAGLILLGLPHVADGRLHPLLVVALGFVAASLVVHFGLFALNAGLWRGRGVRVHEPFVAPYRAVSLREFWARRWNRPFSELTRLAVYAPLVPRTGRVAAVMAGFLFSGLLHELAISVPVRAGYGLPTLYFLLHGFAVIVEERLERRGAMPRGALGRLWCAAWLLLPVPLVFHAPFRAEVVGPLVGL